METHAYFFTHSSKIYYEIHGSGTPLLILHGNSQSHKVFEPFLSYFRPGFQVILMDSRGHGRSRLFVRTALRGFSTEDMADDVAALLRHLHLSSVHLLGFSDGANIGLEIACKYPSLLRSLICLSANASPDGLLTPLYLGARVQRAFLDGLSRFLFPLTRPFFLKRHSSRRIPALYAAARSSRHLLARAHRPHPVLPPLLHRILRRRNLTSLLLHSPHLSARKLQDISTPVLLIAGTRDLIKTSHSRWLSRQIPGSQLLLITGGHHTTFFRTPEPYLNAILRFLRQHSETGFQAQAETSSQPHSHFAE